MIRHALPALLLASVLPAFAQSPAADVPLIERGKIFGNPTKTAAKLSPDGKWLSWIAPRDGVLNLWVAPADKLSQAKPLTDEKTRPIRNSFWSPDSKHRAVHPGQGRRRKLPAVWRQRRQRQADQLHAV